MSITAFYEPEIKQLLYQIILLEEFDIFIHRYHPMLLACLHNCLYLNDFFFTNKVGNRRNTDHHLERADSTATASFQQLLRHHQPQRLR